MSQFYIDAADSALALLKEFGRPIPAKRFARVLDPVTGGVSITSDQSGEFTCVTLTLGKADKDRLDNRLVEALTSGRLRKLLVAAADAPFEPLSNDILLFDSMHWTVRGSTPLSPAGTPLLYTIIVEQTALSGDDLDAFPLIEMEEAVSELGILINETLPDFLQ